jgi:hypothetical protein
MLKVLFWELEHYVKTFALMTIFSWVGNYPKFNVIILFDNAVNSIIFYLYNALPNADEETVVV